MKSYNSEMKISKRIKEGNQRIKLNKIFICTSLFAHQIAIAWCCEIHKTKSNYVRVTERIYANLSVK